MMSSLPPTEPGERPYRRQWHPSLLSYNAAIHRGPNGGLSSGSWRPCVAADSRANVHKTTRDIPPTLSLDARLSSFVLVPADLLSGLMTADYAPRRCVPASDVMSMPISTRDSEPEIGSFAVCVRGASADVIRFQVPSPREDYSTRS